jgi:hypothetical protein
MKKSISIYAIKTLFFSIIIFSSCSKTPDNLLIVPADTKVVMTMNIKSIVEKADPEKVSEMDMYKAIMQEIKNDNRELASILDELKKDPFATGIDPRKDIVGFLVDKSAKDKYMCLSAVLKDKHKFKETVKFLIETSGKDLKIMMSEDIFYIQLSLYNYLVWDDDKMLIANAISAGETKKQRSDILSLFSLENNITENEQFNAFLKHKKDINVWFSYDILKSLPNYQALSTQINQTMLNGTSINSYISFDEKRINWAFEMIPGEEYKKMMGDKKFFFDSFEGDIIKLIPGNQLITMSSAINMKEYYAQLLQQPNMKKSVEAIETQSGINVEEVIETIKGNLVMGIHDFKPAPQFAVAVELHTNEKISNILEKYPQISKNGNLYTFNNATMPVFMVLDKKFCFISNDQQLCNFISEGSYPEANLLSTETGKNVQKCPAYFNFNLNKSDYPADVMAMLEANPQPALILKILDEYAINLEFKTSDMYHGELNLNTTEQEGNSLFNLIALLNSYYKDIVSL